MQAESFLEAGDDAMLVAPRVEFAREIRRMNLLRPKFLAEVSGASYETEALDAESRDLESALKNRKVPTQEIEEIVQAHRVQRQKLADFVQKQKEYKASLPERPPVDSEAQPPPPPPEFPALEPIPGLPQEFADYLAGAVAWHNPAVRDKSSARSRWEHLLELPPTERRYKSTWATYMLAKSWEKETPERAMSYFSQTRQLAKARFVDSIGLAAASLGWEAKLEFKLKHYEPALELYLQQLAAGDESALQSLRIVAGEALDAEVEELAALAKNLRTQRTLTTYSLSLGPERETSEDGPDHGSAAPAKRMRRWLDAVERAEPRDLESAEKFALLAYQQSDFKLARYWIELSSGSPVAEWLRAKLLFREGKLDRATVAWAHVASLFPVRPRNPTNEVPVEVFADTLHVWTGYLATTPERYVLAELGALQLSRGDYVRALDAFLNAGFWREAAYVAERVLSVEELKSYVDRTWPAATIEQAAEEEEKYGEDSVSPALLRTQIRYLLARRLTREIHGDESRPYYPEEWVSQFDALARTLVSGWDESQSVETRAAALLEAARITRTDGMELLGTELEPDWHICSGNCEGTPSEALRGTNAALKLLRASHDELDRAHRHHADPEARFHYRYQAAFLAWEAAKLLPNNSGQTAYVLWQGGSWLKARDPRTADLFYKALVKRNPQTDLGVLANRTRWFPRLDENGQIPSANPEPELPMSVPGLLTEPSEPSDRDPVDLGVSSEQPTADTLFNSDRDLPLVTTEIDEEGGELQTKAYYIVRAGDTLGRIVRKVEQAGIETTWQELLEVNPGLEPSRMKIGQKLLLPGLPPNIDASPQLEN
jgi:hypothetical protein